jgi:prevent-host-death family protein
MTPTATTPPEATVIGAFEAKTHLSRLLRQTRAGQRFIITQRGQPVAELKPVETEPQATLRKSFRGDMAGKIWMADDFCDELEELREFFE